MVDPRGRTDRPGVAVVVLAAIAAWVGGGAGLLLTVGGWSGAALLGAGLAAVVAVTLRCTVGRAAQLVGPVLLVGCCAVAVAVVRGEPLVSGPLPAAAAGGSYVTATVVLSGDPVSREGRVRGSYRGADRVVATATVTSWIGAGRARAESVPVRVAWQPAAPGALPAPGTVLHVRGRLGPDDPLRRSAGYLAADHVEVVAPPPAYQSGAKLVRDSLQRSARSVGGDGGALLPGLVLGDTSAVPDELDQAMRDSGLAHLTAVSGGNVAVTLALVWWVARRAGARRKALLALGAVLLPSYVVLVRPDPSVVRAAVMTGIGMLALLGGRRTRGLPVLAVAVTMLVLLDPFLSVSIGFALSVVATLGLVTIGRRVAGPARRGVARALAQAWGAAVAASLATAPLIAGIGGGVPLLSVPANLLAEPAVGPASVLGLLTGALGLVLPQAAGWLAHAAALPSGWIAGVARHAEQVPGAVLAWPVGLAGALGLALVLVLVVAGLLLARRAGRTRPFVAAAAGLVLVVVVLPAAGVPVPGASWPPRDWVLVACDVGQGDGLVLNAGPGVAVVVDTGPDPRAMDRCLARLAVRSVPVLYLTHDHADHAEGLPGVLRGGRSVGQIVVSPLDDPPTEVSRVLRWAADSQVAVRPAAAGQSQVLGALEWTVLWPDRVLRGTESDPNNSSIVLAVRSAGLTLLLGGDIEPEAQRLLLTDHSPGHVDVVKVPHHGSVHQDPDYASTTSPRLALISCGVDNDYGHPAAATVRAYEAVGALVGRTDTSGDLAVALGADGAPALLSRGKP